MGRELPLTSKGAIDVRALNSMHGIPEPVYAVGQVHVYMRSKKRQLLVKLLEDKGVSATIWRVWLVEDVTTGARYIVNGRYLSPGSLNAMEVLAWVADQPAGGMMSFENKIFVDLFEKQAVKILQGNNGNGNFHICWVEVLGTGVTYWARWSHLGDEITEMEALAWAARD